MSLLTGVMLEKSGPDPADRVLCNAHLHAQEALHIDLQSLNKHFVGIMVDDPSCALQSLA